MTRRPRMAQALLRAAVADLRARCLSHAKTICAESVALAATDEVDALHSAVAAQLADLAMSSLDGTSANGRAVRRG